MVTLYNVLKGTCYSYVPQSSSFMSELQRREKSPRKGT